MWNPPPSRIWVVIPRCGIPPSRTWGDSSLFTTCNFGSQSFYSCKETFRNPGKFVACKLVGTQIIFFCYGSVSQTVVLLLQNQEPQTSYTIYSTVFALAFIQYFQCLQLSVHFAAASIVTVSIYWTFLVGKDIGSVRSNVGRWPCAQGCEELSCCSMTFLQLFHTIPKI